MQSALGAGYSVYFPTDRPVVRVRDLVRRVPPAEGEAAVIHVTDAEGSMSALVTRALALSAARSVVCVTADLDGARRLVDDLAFVLGKGDGGRGVLLFTLTEATPYADINPDRRAAMGRLVTLSCLAGAQAKGRAGQRLPNAVGSQWNVLVVPAPALVRKVVPPSVLEEHSEVIVAEQEIDRDGLAARLARAGYLRVPLVEDPGTFAVRGAVVDMWPASSALPVRMELYGDLVLSLRPFDPAAQRSLATEAEASGQSAKAGREPPKELPFVFLPPVREAILTDAAAERARTRVRALCDAVDLPSSRARAIVEDVTSGRAFFGADGFLPAFYDLSPLLSYVPKDAVVLLEDPPSLTKAIKEELASAAQAEAEKGKTPHFALDDLYLTEASLVRSLGEHTVVALHRGASMGAAPADDMTFFEATPEGVGSLGASGLGDLERAIAVARTEGGKAGALAPLFERLAAFADAGLSTFVAARTQTQAERLAGLLSHHGVTCQLMRGAFDPAVLDAVGPAPRVSVVTGTLARGVLAQSEGFVLITEEEIFGRRVHRHQGPQAKNKSAAFLEDLRALAVGDHVVHVEHGIGKYLGLIHKDIGGKLVDLLVVEYLGGDKLYLPAYRLNQIEKWSGGEGAPKLDRLGGQTFAKTKARAAKEVRQLADELLRLYAERQAMVGEPLPPPDDDYRAFEATFPFDETPDQARAIADVENDLVAPRPMDRLVCGDVGFGKTEVAIRAAFRVVQAGRQVAVLCPTTVLAQQHFLVLENRLRNYPFRVELLSRFRSNKQQLATVAGLKEGKVDIVVGTHRLLSKDVHFRKLGLLIVDEEQRFGVTHKERIKQLRTNVDVLTLTATPIPRTLQMAISGLRDMSLIATAPVDRRAIRTIITRVDDVVMREAIARELARGGQVFYVHNRIEALYERAAKVLALVPEARIATAHGQMSEGALEQTMLDFIEGRYDILVSTAIVENGLDIPRANTMIIDRADMFGLSQLYQLRGRVGRSKERGYCYLVVPPMSSITDEARTRIEALERHTELGSGFQIASLDLELRGAGDLLGAEQSGTVARIGFELFCQLLTEAVHELRGETVVHEVEPELSFDVEALLPEDYIADVGVRLSLYKRLASAESEDAVIDLAAEMQDRFGPPPQSAQQFLHLMRLKTELRRLRVLGCEATAKAVTLHLRDDTPLDPTKLTALVARRAAPYRITPDMRITRRFSEGEVENGLAAADKMLGELTPCVRPG